MKKNIYFKLLGILVILFTSCQTPEELVMENSSIGAHAFNAKFPDGTGDFYPEKPSPYKDGDVVNIVIPWFYPEDSNNETDITKVKLYASLPNNVIVEPGLGGLFDLTKDNHVTVTSPDGTKAKMVIKGERRKSSKKMITEFSLSNGVKGIVFEDKKMVGLIAGGLDLSNLTPTIKISSHATISPAPEQAQNFNNPVKYTITAHDGSKQEYTVQTFIPNKISYGLRKESVKQLFSVKLSDIGIAQANHWTTGIAVSSKYVFVNSRNQDLTYIDRFTGKKVGDVVLPFKGSLANFFVANDNNDNILVTNFNSGNGGTLNIYKIKETGEPQKYITYTGAPVSGRKMSVSGNLDGDAIIMIPVQSSSKVLYWTVKAGTLESQTPKVYTADETKIKWNFVSDAATPETDLSKGIFLAGYGPINAVGFFNTDGSLNAGLNLTVAGISDYVNQALDLAVFNGATYLALGSQYYSWNTTGFIFDVTAPANIGGNPTGPDLLIYKSPLLGTENNANSTADIQLKVSSDGLKMVLYIFGTNGGIDAYEFDCIDVNNLM